MMKQFVRPLMATLLASTLALGTASPSFAQDAGQNPSTPAQTTVGTGATPAISLGMSKYSYSRAPKALPNLIAPYSGVNIPSPELTNSPKIDQLIHDGKLELSLQDTIELALQNSLDIVVARYNVWFADTDLLKTASGGFGRGTAGASFPFSQANLPGLSFDPIVTGTVSFDCASHPGQQPPFCRNRHDHSSSCHAHQPVQFWRFTRFLSRHDGRVTGTILAVRPAIQFDLFNPSVQSALYVSISQQLLNGFGKFAIAATS